MSRSKSKVDSSIIDSKEREALIQFKEVIADILPELNEFKRHDLWLLRWLRARELNIAKSEEMLRKSMAWRAKENMDNIIEWKVPDFLDQEFKVQCSGFDKDGCLIAILPFGRWDVRKAVSLGLKSDYVRYSALLFEQIMRFSEHRSISKTDSIITQFVIIVDFEGYTLGQITSRETIEAILDVVRSFEANQPETLKAAWVVNAPKIFEIFFACIKPIANARTLSKIHVFGNDSDTWRHALLKNIEPDQLPSEYGGSNTSCQDYKVIYGFDVFPVYEVFPENKFVSVTVEPGTKHVVNYVLSAGQKLSWNFRTVNYDIGFSLLCFSTSDGEEADPEAEAGECVDKVLFECSRADSHLYVQKGAFVTDKAGKYGLIFDNSFSRLRSKNLYYAAHTT